MSMNSVKARERLMICRVYLGVERVMQGTCKIRLLSMRRRSFTLETHIQEHWVTLTNCKDNMTHSCMNSQNFRIRTMWRGREE